MLQQDEPDDYVVATGETHTVREFVELAFGTSGSTGSSTSWSTRASGRPRSTSCSATPRKARGKLGWEPKVRFPELVEHDGRGRPRRAEQRRAVCPP